MEFENSRLDAGCGSPSRTRRVWTGLVRGQREAWILIDRTGEALGGWFEDDGGPTPLRMCRAVLDDGVLILGGGNADDQEAEPRRLPEDF